MKRFCSLSRSALLALLGGCSVSSVRRPLFGDEVWTATVWADEAALLCFVQSPAHLQAVRDGNRALSLTVVFR